MSSRSLITIKQHNPPKGTKHACHASPISVQLNSQHDCEEPIGGNLSSTSPSCIQIEPLKSSTFLKDLSLSLKRSSPVPEPESPLSHVSVPEFSEPILSRSSTFCASMHSSSVISSESCSKQNNFPFPHHMKCEQQNSSVQSSNSPLLLWEDIIVANNEDEHTDDLVEDFLNLSGDASEGIIRGENYGNSGLAFSEQMEFQILSEQLGIAITDNGESPGLDVSVFEFLFFSKIFLNDCTLTN